MARGQVTSVVSAVALAIIVSVMAVMLTQFKSSTTGYGCATGNWNASMLLNDPTGGACTANTGTNFCCISYNATDGCCNLTGTQSSAFLTIDAGSNALQLGNILPIVVVAGAIIAFLLGSFALRMSGR